MPQLPPAEEISSWYGGLVRSYLENLKKIMENGATNRSPADA
jgi:hypothetical protein